MDNRLGEPDIVPKLEEFTASPDPEVASAARNAIAALLEEAADSETEN